MSQITLTNNAQTVLDWSKSLPSLPNNTHNSIARELLAILFVVELRNSWLSTRFSHIMGSGVIIRIKITKLLRKLDPQLMEKIDLARQQGLKRGLRDFAPIIDVAKIYKQEIFGAKGSLVKELQTLTRSAPNLKSKDREHRDYNEKMTGIWHELVHFPDELLCRTNNGMTFNIFEDDFKSIEQDVDSLS
jgi:hypothetical protein